MARHSWIYVAGFIILIAAIASAFYYRQQWLSALNQLAEFKMNAYPPAPAPARIPDPVEWEEHSPFSSPAPASPSRRTEFEVSAATSGPQPESQPSDRERPPRRNENWLETMRTNDPERYAEFQQRREEIRQSFEQTWTQRTNYFMQRDTTSMSSQELEEYQLMITLLNETWTLTQKIQNGVPSEERREVFTAVRSNMVALTPLLENERDREFYDLAIHMGQNPTDAVAFVQYIHQITSNTTVRNLFPGMSGRGNFNSMMFRGGNSTSNAIGR